MAIFPLTKTLHPTDYNELLPELAVITPYTTELTHPHRAWEYAMALRAYVDWLTGCARDENTTGTAIDVGGHNSPFHKILADMELVGPSGPPDHPLVLDPGAGTVSVESYVGLPADVVTCISVVEHVPDLQPFLRALVRATKPGGLLFLTSDCWDRPSEVADEAHFHWMRTRIWNPSTWQDLMDEFRLLGLKPLGTRDFKYNGHQLFGSYSFCSMALTRAV